MDVVDGVLLVLWGGGEVVSSLHTSPHAWHLPPHLPGRHLSLAPSPHLRLYPFSASTKCTMRVSTSRVPEPQASFGAPKESGGESAGGGLAVTVMRGSSIPLDARSDA